MKFLVIFMMAVMFGAMDSSMIHNLGGPLATHPSAEHLYDLAFFFRLENSIPTKAYLKIKNPAGFVFQPTKCNYGIITEKTLTPITNALDCQITFINSATYINFFKVDKISAVGLNKDI